MERSNTKQITNFWSHFPNGMTYREMCSMPIEERLERAALPSAVIAVAAEVELVSEISQPEYVPSTQEVSAA